MPRITALAEARMAQAIIRDFRALMEHFKGTLHITILYSLHCLQHPRFSTSYRPRALPGVFVNTSPLAHPGQARSANVRSQVTLYNYRHSLHRVKLFTQAGHSWRHFFREADIEDDDVIFSVVDGPIEQGNEFCVPLPAHTTLKHR